MTLKIISTLQPCLSQGMNAVIVYPIIAIALLEFSISDLRVWKAGLAALLHICVLVIALRMGRLCRTLDLEAGCHLTAINLGHGGMQ